MRTPLIRSAPPLGRGSRVKLLIKDRSLDCARPGQTATVTSVAGNFVSLILDCGHPYQTVLAGVAPSDTQKCTWCWRVVPRAETKPVPRWHNLPACGVCRGEAPPPVMVGEKPPPDPVPKRKRVERLPPLAVKRRVRVGRKLRRLIKEGKVEAP